MAFRYLSRLEGKRVEVPEDIKSSRKHLWAEMVFDEETFKITLAKGTPFEEELQRAVSWYSAYRKDLLEDGLYNKEIESAIAEKRIIPYRIRWSEWIRYRKIFFKAWKSFLENLLT